MSNGKGSQIEDFPVSFDGYTVRVTRRNDLVGKYYHCIFDHKTKTAEDGVRHSHKITAAYMPTHTENGSPRIIIGIEDENCITGWGGNDENLPRPLMGAWIIGADLGNIKDYPLEDHRAELIEYFAGSNMRQMTFKKPFYVLE